MGGFVAVVGRLLDGEHGYVVGAGRRDAETQEGTSAGGGGGRRGRRTPRGRGRVDKDDCASASMRRRQLVKVKECRRERNEGCKGPVARSGGGAGKGG